MSATSMNNIARMPQIRLMNPMTRVPSGKAADARPVVVEVDAAATGFKCRREAMLRVRNILQVLTVSAPSPLP
jgi:hypothetical protein